MHFISNPTQPNTQSNPMHVFYHNLSCKRYHHEARTIAHRVYLSLNVALGRLLMLMLLLPLPMNRFISIESIDEWVECLAHTETSPALDYHVYLCFLVWPNFFISHILTPSKVLFLKHSCKPFKNCFKCEYLLKLEFHPLYTINSFIHSYSHWASPFLLFLYEIVKTVCWIAYWNQMLYWKYSYSKVFFLSIVVIIIVHIRVRVCVCIRFEYTIVCLLYVYNT